MKLLLFVELEFFFFDFKLLLEHELNVDGTLEIRDDRDEDVDEDKDDFELS